MTEHATGTMDVRLEAAQLKERIYATITMISVVLGLVGSRQASVRGAVETVVTASVGLWLAALVADLQAHRVIHSRFASRPELRVMLFINAPLLLSAVGPLVLITFAARGVMSLETALTTSAWVNVATLFLWGCYGGIRMGSGTAYALLAGGIDAAIGTAVALVKSSAGH